MRMQSIVMIALVAAFTAPARAQQSPAAASGAPWTVQRATLHPGSSPTPTSIEIARGIAVRDDLTMRDGTIDFDLAPPMARGGQFVGIAFRMASTADYEIVYFRSGEDGTRWREIQYQPVFDGETSWQLLPGADYAADIPLVGDARAVPKPSHVRLVVRGTRADVYFESMTTPALRIRDLKRAPQPGSVGVWAVSPDGGVAWGAVNNFAVSDRVAAEPAQLPRIVTPAGQLMHWQVSARLPSRDSVNAPRALTPALMEALFAGKKIEADSSGLVLLHKELGNPAGHQKENVFGGAGWGMAVASTTINSATARTAWLTFGYSDGISIFLNGVPVFAGRNDYQVRYNGYLAYLSTNADAVPLQLRAGENELVLIVTDKAFGWGFSARLP